MDDVQIERQQVATVADAVRAGFIGSPTIVIDGMDPFAVDGRNRGLHAGCTRRQLVCVAVQHLNSC